MSPNYIIDSDENSDYMYNVISEIIEKCGPRAPCSEAEKKASELIRDELNKYCDSVELEDFKAYPRAFLGWIRLDLYLILISLLVFIMGFWLAQIFKNPIIFLITSIICLSLGLFSLLIFYKQFFCYKEWTPKFLPYKQGISHNVLGTIKPSGEIKKRVIFSAHIDSAYRFNLIHYTREGYAYFYVMGVILLISYIILYLVQVFLVFLTENIVYIILNILIWLVIAIPLFIAFTFITLKKSDKLLYGALKNMSTHGYLSILISTVYTILIDIIAWQYIFIGPNMMKISIWLFFKSLIIIIALFFFVSGKATPGAIDNLSALAPVICVAKILKEWKENHLELIPKETEIKIVTLGSEEIGLRGASAFCKKHEIEYNLIDTTAINCESISNSQTMKIFTRENTTRTDLSPEVYELLVKCAKELGISYKLSEMPGVAGGTDAAALVKGGLKASSLEGIIWADYLTVYHTDRDNLDRINKKRKLCNEHGTNWKDRNIRCAMENALKIMLKYLELKDKE